MTAGRNLSVGRQARLTEDDDTGSDAGADDESDAPRLLKAIVQAGQDTLRLGRCLDRPQRIIVVLDREAEDSHDGISDDLLDRPAVGPEDGLHVVEIEGQDLAQRFRIESLTERRRSFQV